MAIGFVCEYDEDNILKHYCINLLACVFRSCVISPSEPTTVTQLKLLQFVP